METAIIIATIVVGASAIIFALKTLIDTRKRYYNQFMKNREKRNNKDGKN